MAGGTADRRRPGAVGSAERPLRVAIAGSGPAAFYAAESLFRRKGLAVRVDVFERLPTPYGLVRYGVAPDHENIRKVTSTYEQTAARPGFRFFGNVELGRDVSVDDLRGLYDQVVYAVGAASDRRLGIPGEELAGSISSAAFVGWYTGHPDWRDLNPDLSVERAAVFGIGNVALDVTRILLRDPEELARTDIADYAVEALRESRVREVHLIGRRGVAQAAFSPKEIEELGSLSGVDLVVDRRQVRLSDTELVGIERGTARRKTIEYLKAKSEGGEGTSPRKIRLRFLASPVDILGEGGRVIGVRIEKNELARDDEGVTRARGTGETEVLDAGLVCRAIGYRGVPIPGVPFDEARGIIPNKGGQVVGKDGHPVPRQYVVGWAKRGPSGLIGTNRACSIRTVDRMVEELTTDPGPEGSDAPGRSDVVVLLRARGVRWVTFDDWKLLDGIERERGKADGRPRRKVLGVEDQLKVITQASGAGCSSRDPGSPSARRSW